MISSHSHQLFQYFGSGDDGDVTASSGSLTRNMVYNTLVIPNGVTLDNDHYIIMCKVSLTIQSGGKLWTAPANGTNAAAHVVGIGATQDTAVAKPLGRTFSGITGRTGATGVGGNATNFTSAHLTETNGGGSGNGGAGGAGGAGAGGTAGTVVAETTHIYRRIHPWILMIFSKPSLNTMGAASGGGAASGAGDGVKRGGAGGGSGGGGGCLGIWAPIIDLQSGGELSVQGGNGGNGGDGEAGGNCGGGGGAGSGSGGRIFLYCYEFRNNGTVTLTGGTPGNGGNPSGTGVAGSNGSIGRTGRLIVYNLLSGTWSVT